MAILKTAAPRGAMNVLGEALSDLLPQRPAAPRPGRRVARAKPSQPSASQPLKLFAVRLRDIKNESFTSKASHIGWRYLVVNGGPIAVADLRADKDGATVFNSLTEGPLAERLAKAAALVHRRFGSKRGKHEARILEIPTLSSIALWVHTRAGDDAFVPLLDRKEGKIAFDRTYRSRIVEYAGEKRSMIEEAPSLTRKRKKKGKRR